SGSPIQRSHRVMHLSSPAGDGLLRTASIRKSPDRVPDRPREKEPHHGRPGHETDGEEALERAAEQDHEPQRAPREEVPGPHERLDPEDALESRSLAKRARERVPGAGERSG